MFQILNLKKKGFTLLEVIIAISILITGIVGISLVFSRIISIFPIVSSRLIAAYLAQEGVEIVRNIRDTNWLEETQSWDDGLTCSPRPCSIDFEADYNDQNLSSYTGNPLNFETASSFYGYDLGVATKFRRKITISAPSETYILQVSVLVEWQEKGKPYELKAEEYLYDWR